MTAPPGMRSVAANAWNASVQAKGLNDRNAATVHALAQIANFLEPGAEVDEEECQEHCEVIALNSRLIKECPATAPVLQ